MEMEKIRQMAKEQGIDLKIQGLVCLPWEIKKIRKQGRQGQGN